MRFFFACCLRHAFSALDSFCAMVNGFELVLSPLTSWFDGGGRSRFPEPENVALPDAPTDAGSSGAAGRQTSLVLQPAGEGDGGLRQGDSCVQTRAS